MLYLSVHHCIFTFFFYDRHVMSVWNPLEFKSCKLQDKEIPSLY